MGRSFSHDREADFLLSNFHLSSESETEMLSCQNQEQAKDVQLNFVLEVLANAIRQEKGIRCVQREGRNKAVFVCS